MKRMITAVVIVILLFAGFALIANAGSDHQGDWQEYIERLCEDKDILPELVEAMIEKESSWDPAAALMFYNAGYSDKLGIRAYENGVISSYASEILERAAELERLHGK